MLTTDTGTRFTRATITTTDTPAKKAKKPMNSDGRFIPVSEYFGELTFGLGQMREKLPRESYLNLLKTLDHGKKLTKETAEAIASAVKEWSVSKGEIGRASCRERV